MTYSYNAVPNSHRRASGRVAGARRLFRLGILASTALGAVGAAAGIAQAVTIGDGFSADSSGIAIANNDTFALSNRQDPTTFKDSFTILQDGPVFAASVRNEATAESVACSPDAPCRAVSLSFQIVTMAGTGIDLNAVNSSNAANVHCAGCQTVAGAYQFVVDTPGVFTLGASARSQLAAIHAELNALSNSSLPTAEVQSAADALAVQVAGILKSAVASSPEAPVTGHLVDAPRSAAQAVTVHRDFQFH